MALPQRPELEAALAQASDEIGLAEWYRDCVRPLLNMPETQWPRCCGRGCEPCADTLIAVAERVRELLGDAAREPAALDEPGWSDGLPPCTDCGHCCFFPDERYVLLFDEDLERLGERAAELTHWIKGRCFLRMQDGHCIALRQDGERWLCSVYAIRPGLCREFQRGNDTCRQVVQLRHPRARST